MEKKYDVIALGELLIDFTMNGQSEQGNNMFEACPGGAPGMPGRSAMQCTGSP